MPGRFHILKLFFLAMCKVHQLTKADINLVRVSYSKVQKGQWCLLQNPNFLLELLELFSLPSVLGELLNNELPSAVDSPWKNERKREQNILSLETDRLWP